MDLTLENFQHWFSEIWNLELYSNGEQTVYLSQLLIALGFVCVGILVSRRIASQIGYRLEKTGKIQRQTAYFIQRLFFYLFLIVVLLVALPIAGIPVTIFTVIGGALAIGVGFGAQNLFNNLISGIILLLESPIRVGDIVELNGQEGRVEEIGNRCVRVRRTDGVDMLVPNSNFLDQMVINWTLNDNDVRGHVTVGVAYGSPTKKVRDLIEQAAREHKLILNEPSEPIVLFEEFGDNSLNFRLLFWANVNRPMVRRRIESDLRYRIDELFREHGIVIAFPQRDVHLDTTKPLEVTVRKEKDTGQ